MITGQMHPKLADELKRARIQFSKTAAKDERAALLTLVDPIRMASAWRAAPT